MTGLVDMGRNIVLLRQAQGLTQEQVAFRSGLSVSRLQDLEYGCRNTTADTLIHLAKVLHVDSRILGIFLLPDEVLRPVFRCPPLRPAKAGNPFQVCENILLLRKARDMTQAELARQANISVSCLRDIEHGCANMTTTKLLSIAQVFDMSLLELSTLSVPEDDLWNAVFQARAQLGKGLV